MNPKSTRDFASLIEALRSGATSAPPWHLNHRERWTWLTETLLGHPLHQPRQRPRDFPADPVGRKVVDAAIDLQKRQLATWNSHRVPRGQTWYFGAWIFPFCMLVEGSVLQKYPEQAEANAHKATLWVIHQILRAHGAGSDDAACQQLLAGLGLGLSDGGPLVNPPLSRWGSEFYLDQRSDDEIAACAEGAAWLALIMKQAPTKEGAAPPTLKNPVARRILEETKVSVVTVKTIKVMPYLRRAQNLWAVRGASVWAAQVLAEAREALQGGTTRGEAAPPRLMLLGDVDAQAQFAAFQVPEGRHLSRQIRQHFQSVWSERGVRSGIFDRYFPRLGSFLSSIPPVQRAQAIKDIRSCLPKISIQINPPKTLQQLCTRQTSRSAKLRKEPSRPALESGATCHILSLGSYSSSMAGCHFVAGSRGLFDENEIPWLHQDKRQRRIGWTGAVWTLAGSTYRMHASHGLVAMMHRPGMALLNNHEEWIAGLTPEDHSVAYLKLDGDHVGAILKDLPLVAALMAGLRIQPRVFQGLRSGLGSVLKTIHCGETSSSGKSAHMKPMPMELVYQGGDDLLCILPNSLLPNFLEGFATPSKIHASPTFTGVAVIVPGHLATLGPSVPFLVAQLIPPALEWAKRKARKESTSRLKTDLVARATAEGFVLEFAKASRTFRNQVQVWDIHMSLKEDP